MANKKLWITDTTLRDGHQSLWATRMRTDDILNIIDTIDNVGYYSLEVWGGATFDVCLRFLRENPWERLRQIKAKAQDWLKAAKKLNGGENLEAYVYFPIAVNGVGEMDMMFIVVAPSFEDWGKFWDAYAGSPVNELDNQNAEVVVCPNSVVWESFKVE